MCKPKQHKLELLCGKNLKRKATKYEHRIRTGIICIQLKKEGGDCDFDRATQVIFCFLTWVVAITVAKTLIVFLMPCSFVINFFL